MVTLDKERFLRFWEYVRGRPPHLPRDRAGSTQEEAELNTGSLYSAKI